MKRILLITLMVIFLSICISLGGVTAKLLDKASPLANNNSTSEKSLKVDTAGHADYVKSQDNSTTNKPKTKRHKN